MRASSSCLAAADTAACQASIHRAKVHALHRATARKSAALAACRACTLSSHAEKARAACILPHHAAARASLSRRPLFVAVASTHLVNILHVKLCCQCLTALRAHARMCWQSRTEPAQLLNAALSCKRFQCRIALAAACRFCSLMNKNSAHDENAAATQLFRQNATARSVAARLRCRFATKAAHARQAACICLDLKAARSVCALWEMAFLRPTAWHQARKACAAVRCMIFCRQARASAPTCRCRCAAVRHARNTCISGRVHLRQRHACDQSYVA